MMNYGWARARDVFWRLQAGWEQTTEIPDAIKQPFYAAQARAIAWLRGVDLREEIVWKTADPDVPYVTTRGEELEDHVRWFWECWNEIRLRSSHVSVRLGPIWLDYAWAQPYERRPHLWANRECRPGGDPQAGVDFRSRRYWIAWRGGWWS